MNTLQHQLANILQWVILKNPWTTNTTVIWITMKNGCLAIQVSRLWWHKIIIMLYISNGALTTTMSSFSDCRGMPLQFSLIFYTESYTFLIANFIVIKKCSVITGVGPWIIDPLNDLFNWEGPFTWPRYSFVYFLYCIFSLLWYNGRMFTTADINWQLKLLY